MEDYYEYLDSNGVTTLYKLIKDDTVALIDSYSVTLNGITTNLDNHTNNTDIHTPITDIESMVDTKISGLVNSAPETLDTLKELSDALGNDPNFATTIANQIGSKANSVHSHVVSDITDFPTIPTKTSELINDSGYITSISWTNITDKPNFSTVATSGSYTDLSNTPTIPTKLSQLENDMGFGTGGSGDTSDCVHKTGNETIGGTKTFTSGPWVTNNHTTTGYSIKNTALARNEIPSEYQHYTFRAYDKNNNIMGEYCIEKSTGGDALLHMNVRSEDSSGTQIVYGMQFRMTNDGSLVRFMPSANNKVHLGDVGAKWASVHATNAHVTNTYTNRVTTYSIVHPTDDSYFYLSGGTNYDKGANLYLYSYGYTGSPGAFNLQAKDSTQSKNLVGFPDGRLTWGGKNIAIDDNVVHTSGNEHISGTKIFNNTISRHADLTTSGGEQVYNFYDINPNSCGHIFNNAHWTGDAIYNRYGAYNAKTGKTAELDITSNDAGVGMLYVAGTATKGNLETVTSATGHIALATMGWVNNPTTSTNVVHRSGDETIAGNKTFSNRVSFPSGYYITTDTNDNSLRIIRDGTGHGNNYKVIIQGDTGKFFSPNGFMGNLQGNADTATSATKASCLDNYSNPGGNRIYLDWNNQLTSYVGLKVDNTTMGGLITTKNIGSQTAKSATYSTTPASTDNSTRIATTAWVRTYVNSVVGSGSVGASISAYYSNTTTVTATGSTTGSGGVYPADYSDYINIAPTVGTIYTGSQLFSSFTPTASGTINKVTTGPSSVVYQTTASAKATFSGAFSASAKYLCTTANAVKFRAYVSQGSSSAMGSPSVVNQSSSKSIFLRIQ